MKIVSKAVLKVATVALMAVVALSGCQSIKTVLAKRDNGSLDYAKAKKLEPIQLPVGQATASFTPLYHTPTITGEVAVSTNASGKQFELPAPPKVVSQ